MSLSLPAASVTSQPARTRRIGRAVKSRLTVLPEGNNSECNRDNIRRIFDRVDTVDFNEGLNAYRMYRRTMRELSAKYDVRLSQTVAVFCATSPNTDNLKNLRTTATLLWGFRHGFDITDLTVATYRACGIRAWSYLHGTSFLNTTRGPKIRNFYTNILWPNNPTAVTIDGHMVSLWYGKRLTMKQALATGFKYNTVADDFRTVAQELRLLPSQLQSMLWYTWKRIHGVKFEPQMNLFLQSNQWRNYIPADEIIPYVPISEKPKKEPKEDVKRTKRLPANSASLFTWLE
jgi:hypothetical protein